MLSNAINLKAEPSFKKIFELNNQPEGLDYIRLDSGVGYIDGIFKRDPHSDALVVLFPAALSAASLEASQFPYIPRWQWAEHIPANVWCFEESLARKYNIAAAWFHERGCFYADVIGDVIRNMSRCLSINNERITLIGSSLGGFGSLMVAPVLPGSRAIADITQTDLLTYPIRRAVENFCEKIYDTRDVEAVSSEFRDRFSVTERFRALGRVPDMTILHDISDEPNGQRQIYPFFSEIAKIQTDTDKPIQVEGLMRNTGKGHVALYREAMVPILKRVACL